MDISHILLKNPLFDKASEDEIRKMLNCFETKTTVFEKGRNIYNVGDIVHSIGVIISGRIHIIKYDFLGNSHIIQGFESGELFAESYACQKNAESLVDVVATEDSEILLIKIDKIFQQCPFCCSSHQTIIKNLLHIIAEKNFRLIKKIELISPKNIRERILAYLSQMHQYKGNPFEIPFNRQQLADYLLVDRSALSAELSKMQKEGLIEYKKNQFILKASHRLFEDKDVALALFK